MFAAILGVNAGSEHGALRFRAEYYRTLLIGAFPLFLITIAIAIFLGVSESEKQHWNVFEQQGSLFATDVNTFITNLDAELRAVRNLTTQTQLTTYQAASAACEQSYTALWSDVTAKDSKRTPSSGTRLAVATIRQELLSGRRVSKVLTSSDVVTYGQYGLEPIAAVIGLLLDLSSETTSQLTSRLVLSLGEAATAQLLTRLQHAINVGSAGTVLSEEEYMGLLRSVGEMNSIYSLLSSIDSADLLNVKNSVSTYHEFLTRGYNNVTRGVSIVSNGIDNITFFDAEQRLKLLLLQVKNRNMVTERHWVPDETPLFGTALGLAVAGMILAIILAIRFANSTSVARQMAHDFSNNEEQKRILECYKDAFTSFHFDSVAVPKSPSIVEMALQRVVNTLRQVRPFLPQTLMGGTAKQPVLRIDGAMTFRNVTVMCIHVNMANNLMTSVNVPPEGEELEGWTELFDELIECIQQVTNENGGSIHSIHGTSIMCVWNATWDCETHSTNALHAALELQERIGEMNQIEDLAIGLSAGSVLLCNVKAHRKKHVSIIGTPVDSAERLQTLASLRNVSLLFDQDVLSGLPRGGTLGWQYRPLCIVRSKDDSELVAHTTIEAASLKKDQIKSYATAFSLYHGKMFVEAAAEFKKYIAQYPDDQEDHATWLLNFVEDANKKKSKAEK
eukprot:PhF_6_TR39721/c0_g1_i3/m.59135